MNLLPDYFLFFSSIEAGYSYYIKLNFEIFLVEQSLGGKKCWIRLRRKKKKKRFEHIHIILLLKKKWSINN
jgi:hypothetical protein